MFVHLKEGEKLSRFICSRCICVLNYAESERAEAETAEDVGLLCCGLGVPVFSWGMSAEVKSFQECVDTLDLSGLCTGQSYMNGEGTGNFGT